MDGWVFQVSLSKTICLILFSVSTVGGGWCCFQHCLSFCTSLCFVISSSQNRRKQKLADLLVLVKYTHKLIG